MLDLVNQSEKKRFDHGILTTFGKLDLADIEEVDGRPELLVPLLMKLYRWSSTTAQHKVDQFTARISSHSL